MADVAHLEQRIIGRTRIAVGRAAGLLENQLRNTGPQDEGNLNGNTVVRATGPNRLEVRVGVEYATYVRDGTEPHDIYPHNQFLAFYWPDAPGGVRKLPDGRALARKVHHPGTDPNPWYNNAVKDLPRIIQSELNQLGDT